MDYKGDSKPRNDPSKDDKCCGVYDHKAGGKCETLDGLWHKPNTITGGSADQRLGENNYCKTAHAKKDDMKGGLKGVIDMVMNDTSGPPYTNVSRPKRVF